MISFSLLFLQCPAVRLPADRQPADRLCGIRRASLEGDLLHCAHLRRHLLQHHHQQPVLLPGIQGRTQVEDRSHFRHLQEVHQAVEHRAQGDDR